MVTTKLTNTPVLSQRYAAIKKLSSNPILLEVENVMKVFKVVALVLTLALAGSAFAAPTNIDFEDVDNSAALTGYVTTDIEIDYVGQWFGAQLIVDLDEDGDIYQDGFGGDTGPNSALFGFVPSLEFDTFLAAGSLTATVVPGESTIPSLGAWAQNLGSSGPAEFSANAIDKAWNAPGGVVITTKNDWVIARITLAADANGTFKVATWAGGVADELRIDGTIVNGVFTTGAVIPEPTTIGLLGMSVLAMIRRRRA